MIVLLCNEYYQIKKSRSQTNAPSTETRLFQGPFRAACSEIILRATNSAIYPKVGPTIGSAVQEVSGLPPKPAPLPLHWPDALGRRLLWKQRVETLGLAGRGASSRRPFSNIACGMRVIRIPGDACCDGMASLRAIKRAGRSGGARSPKSKF